MLLSEAFLSEKIIPNLEIRENRLSTEIFGLEFSSVISGNTSVYYSDPDWFFQKTYFTRTMRSILQDILSKTGRNSGRSCYVLDTTFGGGKTHLLVTLWHMFKSPIVALNQEQIRSLVEDSKLEEIPDVAIVAIDGNNVDADEQTLWGCFADSLGLEQEASYLHKKKSSPTREKIKEMLLSAKKPVVILLDELVVYLRKARTVQAGETTLASQTGPFIQALLGAIMETPNCVVVITLSAIEQAYKDESAILAKHMQDIKSIAERLSWVTAPIEKEEIYHIVKKQLFEYIDPDTASEVAEALILHYEKYSDQFIPKLFAEVGKSESPQKGVSREYLEIAYPFHYAFIDLIYERIGSLPEFHKTRGVLRLLSQILIAVWNDRNELPPHEVIAGGTVDLRVKGIRDELTVKIGKGDLDQVIQTDIVNNEGNARSQLTDGKSFGGEAVAVSTAIYLYSLVGKLENGVEKRKSKLGGSLPELTLQCCLPSSSIRPGDLEMYINKLDKTLWFIYERGGRYFFKPEYNINKVIAERAARIQTKLVKNRANVMLKEHFKGAFFSLYVLTKELDRVKGNKPALVIVDWDYATTTGENVPEEIKDLMQRYPGGIFRDEQNLIYCLIPYSVHLEEMKESIKRIIAAEELMNDPVQKTYVPVLKKRNQEFLANAYSILELLYTYIAYPDQAGPKLISLTSGNQDASNAHEKVVSALFNAHKFTDHLEGWVLNEEILSGKIMTVNEAFEKISNSPGQILTVDNIKKKKPDSPKAIFMNIIPIAVENKDIGLYNGAKSDLEIVTEDNYEKCIENFYFGPRKIQKKTIGEDSILIPKEISEELVRQFTSIEEIVREKEAVPDQTGGANSTNDEASGGSIESSRLAKGSEGSQEFEGPIIPKGRAVSPKGRTKPQRKIINTIEALEQLPEEIKVVEFGIIDHENLTENWINDITRFLNQLNLVWRGDDISLTCDLKIGGKLRLELNDVSYSLILPFMRWCSDIIREVSSRSVMSGEKEKFTFKTKTDEGRLLIKSLKDLFSNIFQKAPNSFRLTIIQP